jgi:hypothetical protein
MRGGLSGEGILKDHLYQASLSSKELQHSAPSGDRRAERSTSGGIQANQGATQGRLPLTPQPNRRSDHSQYLSETPSTAGIERGFLTTDFFQRWNFFFLTEVL